MCAWVVGGITAERMDWLRVEKPELKRNRAGKQKQMEEIFIKKNKTRNKEPENQGRRNKEDFTER